MAVWSGKLTIFIRLLVYIFCFIALTIQFGHLIEPTITNTNVEERDLKEIGFPLLLKIGVRPGFNLSAINNAGYKGIFDFFLGKSMHNK